MFDVFRAVSIRITVVWCVTQCSLIEYINDSEELAVSIYGIETLVCI